jgi:hypothetical protein
MEINNLQILTHAHPYLHYVNEKVVAPELVEMTRKHGGRLAKDVLTDYRYSKAGLKSWAVRGIYQSKVDADPSAQLHACSMPSPGDCPDLGDYYFGVGDMLVVGDGNVILDYDKAGTTSKPRWCEEIGSMGAAKGTAANDSFSRVITAAVEAARAVLLRSLGV